MHQFLGQELLNLEAHWFSHLSNKHFGKHALLIGVPNQQSLLTHLNLSFQTLITPLIGHSQKNINLVEGELPELPILTGSIDLVILPHTLEFIDHPRQLLSEACRIIKPEGLILISGFNPYSTWGLKKLWTEWRKKNKITPWNSNFIRPSVIKKWLDLADFKLEHQSSALFRPPINHASLYHKFSFMEKFGKIFFPTSGGIYFLVARAKVIPLTPIKLKWKQRLTSIGIPTSIHGNIARQSKIFS